MPTSSRLAALAAGSSLVLTGLVAAPAVAAPDPSPVDQGVDWLTAQDFFSVGSRIDVLQQLSLLDRLDSGAAADQLAAIKSGAAGYATSAEASAKVSFAGDLVDEDAGTWGAGDLVQKTADGVDDASGRIEGEYVTPASQALAVRALGAFDGRTAHAEYAAARDYLLTQQCADGRFRDGLAANTCDADEAAGSADATAFTVLYLDDSTDAAVTQSVTKARAWLASSQEADGSWKSPDQSWGPGVNNTNSTGLATLALGAGEAATKGAAWLRQVQARDAGTCTTAIAAGDKGAMAYTEADYGYGLEGGLDEGQFTRGGWVFASQQAVAALQWAPERPGATALTGASKYLRAGSQQRLTARNLAEHSLGCLTGPGTKQSWEATDATWLYRNIKLPARTGNYTYKLVDSAGQSDTFVVKTLAKTTLKVTRHHGRVKQGGIQRLVVRGLEPGERLYVFYKNKRIRTATASKWGTYVTEFRVGRQRGVQGVAVLGEFADIRRGKTFFRVVR